LSVLRNRLPVTVQELCVDVSRSELAGMQQLQQTVERLANRVASASAVLEAEKCKFLQVGTNSMLSAPEFWFTSTFVC
jgi:hypothetical protein